jgi:tryptophanyl-tRNA synthetase
VLRRKVLRAVTDTGTEVVYDRERRPGVSNLLDILAACTRDDPTVLAGLFDRYGELKEAVADAVIATLAPVRERYLALSAEPDHVRDVLRSGAKRARERAAEKVAQAKTAIGLLPA